MRNFISIELWYRIAAMTVFCIILAAGSALAQTERLYVTDEVKLTVRSGPGMDRKILSIIESGDLVEVFEESTEWSRVQLRDGKEGWVLTRYLTPQKPHRLVLEELQGKHESITTRAASLSEESQKLKTANETLQNRVQSLETELEALKTDHEALRKTADAGREEIRKSMVFFVSGAGILFVGILLGLFTRKPRRKSMLV